MVKSLKGKRILVTGATGFIGSHLVRRLHREGAEVHILMRKNSNKYRLLEILGDLIPWCGDLTDPLSLTSCVRSSKPQIVFHLATFRNVNRDAKLMDLMIDTNVKGTVNLIRSIIDEHVDLEFFINTGTCEEYGDAPAPFYEDMKETPVSPYSASKVAATYFCQMISKTMDLPITTLRPFLTYGPFQDPATMFIPSLIYHCLKGKEFKMTKGDQTREFTYIDDTVEAYILASQCQDAAGEILNIGNGIEHSIKGVGEKIVKMMGNPIRLLAGAMPKRAGETEHFFCNNEKAVRLLGWLPTTTLDVGLKQTIAWFKENWGAFENIPIVNQRIL
jgi:UDP-glucose 4-epimerase